jgi:hypothetical protein
MGALSALGIATSSGFCRDCVIRLLCWVDAILSSIESLRGSTTPAFSWTALSVGQFLSGFPMLQLAKLPFL